MTEKEKYENIIRVLMNQIENLVTDGDEPNYDEIQKALLSIGLDMNDEWFIP